LKGDDKVNEKKRVKLEKWKKLLKAEDERKKKRKERRDKNG